MTKTHIGILLPFTVAIAFAASEKTIPVKIDLVEALSPKDTTSSLRFQKEFDQTIKTGTDALKRKAAGCGYFLETTTSFFDANDPLQAKESGEKSNKSGTWIIVGPRRSNHYLLLAKGSGFTPTVSLMASASEIAELGPRHTSLSPQNMQMAKVAARVAKRETKKKAKYISVVSEDCLSCVDFNNSFNKAAAALGLQAVGEFKIKGETPDLKTISEPAPGLNPDFVLVPNFSKVSAQVISALSPKLNKTLFVGSDGWGDSNFGFLQDDAGALSAKGITVRGFPPVDQALSQFSLGRAIQKSQMEKPTGGPGVAILKALDGITEILCESKPKTKDQFAIAFEKKSAKKLSAPFGVSLYRLERSNISYDSKVGIN